MLPKTIFQTRRRLRTRWLVREIHLAWFGTITFGLLENSKTFKNPVLDDGILETDETVSLLLSDAVGVALIALPEAKLRIIDNETPGSIDLSFNGAIAPDSGGWSGEIHPHGLAIQPDGKFLLSDELFFGPDNYRSLVRLNLDGTLDSTFKPIQERMTLVALEPDGRLLVRRSLEGAPRLGQKSLAANVVVFMEWGT